MVVFWHRELHTTSIVVERDAVEVQHVVICLEVVLSKLKKSQHEEACMTCGQEVNKESQTGVS